MKFFTKVAVYQAVKHEFFFSEMTPFLIPGHIYMVTTFKFQHKHHVCTCDSWTMHDPYIGMSLSADGYGVLVK